MRFSRPVAPGSAPERCPTTPMTRRTVAGRRNTSTPSTWALPSSGRARLVKILTVVDLPGPVGADEREDGTTRDRQGKAIERPDAGGSRPPGGLGRS